MWAVAGRMMGKLTGCRYVAFSMTKQTAPGAVGFVRLSQLSTYHSLISTSAYYILHFFSLKSAQNGPMPPGS